MSIPLDRAKRVLDPSFFELIVFPTEKCNFRCTYCYEDFEIGKMSRRTIDAVKRLIDRRADGSADLLLSWFGGEPLTAAQIVLEISDHAQKAFDGSGRNYVSHATTNAYLLRPQLFDALTAVGVRKFQITLDGPREVHNRTRLRRDGAGTFDVIWSNLIAMAERARTANYPRFNVTLRLHYDGRSVDELGPLIKDVVHHFSIPTHFAVNLHELERLGGANDHMITSVTRSQADLVRRYSAELESSGLDTLIPADAEENYVCYAARGNSLIVRADGKISKCTVALREEYNNVGHLLDDGRVALDDEKLRPWMRGLYSGEAGELSCPNVNFPAITYSHPVTLRPGRIRV